MSWIKRWKEKWGIQSNVQFILINIAFAITGSLTVFIRKPVFALVGIEQDASFLVKATVYLLSVTPSYFIILMFVGSLLGQYRFFLAFERKMLNRFRWRKNT